MPDEKVVPGEFRHDPHFDPVFRIGATVEILHIKIAALGMGQHVRVERVEGRPIYPAVALPPDVVLGRGRHYHVLVLRRAAGKLAGVYQQRASDPKFALTAAQRVRDKIRLGQIVKGSRVALYALMRERETGVNSSVIYCHGKLLGAAGPHSGHNPKKSHVKEEYRRLALTVSEIMLSGPLQLMWTADQAGIAAPRTSRG